MTRKSPRRHQVHKHIRKKRLVGSYIRGKDIPTTYITKTKLNTLQALRRKVEKQGKKLIRNYANWEIEFLHPITKDGIETSIRAQGEGAHVHLVNEEFKGKKIIGFFHSHPYGTAEFSRADIRTAFQRGYKIIAVGRPNRVDPKLGEVKVLVGEEIGSYIIPKRRRRPRRRYW